MSMIDEQGDVHRGRGPGGGQYEFKRNSKPTDRTLRQYADQQRLYMDLTAPVDELSTTHERLATLDEQITGKRAELRRADRGSERETAITGGLDALIDEWRTLRDRQRQLVGAELGGATNLASMLAALEGIAGRAPMREEFATMAFSLATTPSDVDRVSAAIVRGFPADIETSVWTTYRGNMRTRELLDAGAPQTPTAMPGGDAFGAAQNITQLVSAYENAMEPELVTADGERGRPEQHAYMARARVRYTVRLAELRAAGFDADLGGLIG